MSNKAEVVQEILSKAMHESNGDIATFMAYCSSTFITALLISTSELDSIAFDQYADEALKHTKQSLSKSRPEFLKINGLSK